MPSLLDLILKAARVRDVTDLIQSISEDRRLAWKPVGDNDNNLATINLGSDPGAGVIERITNAFDAVLELEWNQRGQPSHLMSPRSAVAQFFGIRDGKLANVENLEDPDIVALTERVSVSLRDSERPDRPTVDVRDRGVGLKAEEFASTILSLNRSRKLRRLFLAGAYGQGGSTALAYSPYTIILSRARNESTGEGRPRLNPVAFTIVRFNPGDARIDKHGVYEYMVDHATGQPITISAPERSFPHGTLVRHVSMDLGKYRSVITSPTGSLWFLVHNYLFDPVLPFRIEELRHNSGEGTIRSSAGNHRLLTRGRNTEYQRSATLTFRDGSVTVSWWVLSAEGDSARDRITQYVYASKPIVITYNGQKQGDFPNTVIKTDLRLPYLERFLVAHVDCDKLDNESRRQLFPTTREALRDTAIGEDLKRLVIDTLSGDENLHRLDRERRLRFVSRMDSEAVEQIRKRLASRVRNVILASAGGRGPRVLPPEAEHHTPADRPPIPVQEPPTLLEVTSPTPRKVYAGRRFTVQFKTDADPAYFVNPDTFIAIIDPPGFGQYSGTTNVRDGYGTAYFQAAEDLPLETTADITLEVRPKRATSLRASLIAEVAELPAPAGVGEGRVPTPNITPIWVSEGHPFWVANNWNASSVAKVVQSPESIEVFVSADNHRLAGLITRAQRRDTAAVETVRNFYLEHIAYYSVLASFDIDRTRTRENGGQQPDPQVLEVEQERELQRACETICGIVEDVFEVIITQGSVLTASTANVEVPFQLADLSTQATR